MDLASLKGLVLCEKLTTTKWNPVPAFQNKLGNWFLTFSAFFFLLSLSFCFKSFLVTIWMLTWISPLSICNTLTVNDSYKTRSLRIVRKRILSNTYFTWFSFTEFSTVYWNFIRRIFFGVSVNTSDSKLRISPIKFFGSYFSFLVKKSIVVRHSNICFYSFVVRHLAFCYLISLYKYTHKHIFMYWISRPT